MDSDTAVLSSPEGALSSPERDTPSPNLNGPPDVEGAGVQEGRRRTRAGAVAGLDNQHRELSQQLQEEDYDTSYLQALKSGTCTPVTGYGATARLQG